MFLIFFFRKRKKINDGNDSDDVVNRQSSSRVLIEYLNFSLCEMSETRDETLNDHQDERR